MIKYRTYLLVFFFALLNLPIFLLVAIGSRLWRSVLKSKKYIVFWGTEPIINSVHWAKATSGIFTKSEFVTRYDSRILNGRADKTLFSAEEIPSPISRLLRSFYENAIFLITFSKVLSTAQLVCISCDGFIFQHYKILGFNYKVEFFLLKIANVNVCVLTYGGDAYVYSRVQDKNWLYGLVSDYPKAAQQQNLIASRVDFYVSRAAIFLPGAMIFDGMGRSDWMTPSTLCINIPDAPRVKKTDKQRLTVTHAPNHRAVKGTSFVISTISRLVARGVAIELKLIENKTNQEVMKILAEESDVHVDQLFFDGYGLNALESMSLGVPTIGNFSGSSREFFDRWTFTRECPIILANEDTLFHVLSKITENKDLLQDISEKSVEYVRKYHSPEAFATNFSRAVKNADSRYAHWLKANGERIYK
jgi:glycosyltransferase involved in cell wall biosynthesis